MESEGISGIKRDSKCSLNLPSLNSVWSLEFVARSAKNTAKPKISEESGKYFHEPLKRGQKRADRSAQTEARRAGEPRRPRRAQLRQRGAFTRKARSAEQTDGVQRPEPLHVCVTTHNQINPVHRPKYQLPRKLNKNTEMIYGVQQKQSRGGTPLQARMVVTSRPQKQKYEFWLFGRNGHKKLTRGYCKISPRTASWYRGDATVTPPSPRRRLHNRPVSVGCALRINPRTVTQRSGYFVLL